ncbi:MAG: DNA primase [ANME-2 cluster archaeon]|nr:DNA primase [ANME-2 cluster archaeon]MBC2701919.1 DNA primase [ANME-2 cluster archaeon]MBC2707821.1 DNA primase [ANME-2 cluster archaeon]MBC2747852.1 DNA primase [ANME-2 cluster archaeon]
MDDLERLEKLEGLILELQQMSDKGAVIIVEGKRDRKALRALGITGDIELGTKKSILVFCEDVAREYNNVIVLTDWDEKGDKLASLMEGYLRSTSAAVNMDIRKKIKNLVQKRIKDIESLDTHISNLRHNLKHF